MWPLARRRAGARLRQGRVSRLFAYGDLEKIKVSLYRDLVSESLDGLDPYVAVIRFLYLVAQ